MLLALACIGLFSGCSMLTRKYDYTVEADSFYVSSTGQIKAAMIEDFDKDYYDLAELTYLAKEQVLTYNKMNYGQEYYAYDQLTDEQKKNTLLAVAIESIEKKDDTVTIVFSYGSGKTYTEFNGIDIQKAGGTTVYTSYLENSQKKPGGSMISAKGGDPVSTEELMQKEGYLLVYVDYSTKITFEHEVEYVSSNVTVLSNNAVQTPSGEESYIIFKR